MNTPNKEVNKKEKLLIIDDNPGDLILCEHNILTSHLGSRLDVVTADSYEEALDLFASMTFVCCLVDYHLPTDSGMDFLKHIRRLENGANIAVIIMTGEGDERLAVEIMRNGAQDYLVKNDLSPESLSRSITNAIRTNQLQTKLHYLAHYDNLTGLLNRGLFMDRVQTTLDQCDRHQQTCSLLYIDVDNFKQVNDQYGHEIGDRLLKEIGSRMQASCRKTDSPARLGGDEFAILLTHIDSADSQSTAAKILENVSQPIELESHRIHISLSIGIAHYPDVAKTLQELMRQADDAMYKAKKTGKAKYYQFTQQQQLQWERRHRLESILPKAIEQNELKLAFQPIVNAKTQDLHSLEVFSRWYPAGETVPAWELIELVERLGLFDLFHTWLIHSALEQLQQWQQYYPNLRFSLNIPADQCHSHFILTTLQQAFATYNIKPEQIELEITETTLMKNPSSSSQILQSMQREGITIAIDDFGTGYSSMAYLTTLPINTLKIDQHFFIDTENDERNRKVVEAVTALGHSLGLKVVAEGVETATQYQMAKDIGCDLIQGYYFAKPALGINDWDKFLSQFPDLPGQSDHKNVIAHPIRQ